MRRNGLTVLESGWENSFFIIKCSSSIADLPVSEGAQEK